ncbi:MAG: DUF4177 domain-containing protein [Caldilineaceae bacterium]
MWDYKVEEYADMAQDLSTFLNRHGEDGWELVTFVPTSWVHSQGQSMKEQLSSPETLVIFKRQR